MIPVGQKCKRPVTNARRRARAGRLFVLPWLIGALLFFVQPLVQVVQYAFTNLQFSPDVGMVLEPLDGLFDNFRFAFLEDTNFPRRLVDSLTSMLYQIPVILLFSLFVAIVLGQKFRGRGVMRAIFFLPVIVTSGVIATVIRTSMAGVTLGAGDSAGIFNATVLMDTLVRSGMPDGLVSTVGGMVSNVSDLVWKSGVQILIFLTGILAIPESHYDVARVEGATGWDTFCKVVFPTVVPYILVNFVYTMIDIFVSYDNAIMRWISDLTLGIQKSYAAAMALSYFLIIMGSIAVILGLVTLFTRARRKGARG